MSTSDTQFISTINKGGERIFVFKFDDSCRTNFSTNTITLTFFLVYDYQAHIYSPFIPVLKGIQTGKFSSLSSQAGR
jgi:hypothetical protein